MRLHLRSAGERSRPCAAGAFAGATGAMASAANRFYASITRSVKASGGFAGQLWAKRRLPALAPVARIPTTNGLLAVTRKLLVATHNPGKVREYRALLQDLPLAVTWLDDEGISHEVDETADSFAGNATLKAQEYAALSGAWTWADDSGLCVDALNGRPGVLSARYGGPGQSDAQRWARVLDELRAFPRAQWTASFRCVVALATPAGALQLAHGRLDGIITDEPRGSFGFGYDPIFFLPSHGCTLAELPPAAKNQISHRAVASHAARAQLIELLAAAGA